MSKTRPADYSGSPVRALALLALMLSFTFAMALTRFDERRNGVLIEANAIGTAALRAGLLPAPHGGESVKLFHDYVHIRLDRANRVPTPAELNSAIVRSNEIQAELWRQAKAAMAIDNSMAPTGLYIQALNETFDNQQKRLTAFRACVPSIVLVALYGLAMVAICFAGYASGLEGRRWRLPVYVMALLVAGVMLLIQDIDRPSAGLVAVSPRPMVDTAKAIADYVGEFNKNAPQRAR